MEELIKQWKRYLEYCEKQQKDINRQNRQMRKDYDKEFKKLPDYIRFRAVAAPPVIHSVYETPNFTSFMEWVMKEADK